MYQAASYNHPKQWIELVELLYLNKQIDCNSSNRKYSIEGENQYAVGQQEHNFYVAAK